MKVSPKPALKLLPFAVALCCAQTALAQQSQPSDVVEITAQKRTEKIQDVPLAVSAISGAALESRGIEGAGDLAGAIPNLHMSQTPVSGLTAAVGMRGMAVGQPAIWADPAVGIYVDGVFVGKNTGALVDVVDIERLEALRGPQGTLFGRNTAAGAINFITRKPSGEFTGQVGLDVGNYNRQVTRVSMDLPKVGILSSSVAVRNEIQDGFVKNLSGGRDLGDRDRQSARLALRLEPAKDVKIDYAFDLTDINDAAGVGSLISSTGYGSLYNPATTLIGGTTYLFQNGGCILPTGCSAPGTGIYVSPGFASQLAGANPNYPTSVSTDVVDAFQAAKIKGHTLQAEMPLGQATLRYIGAVREMEYADKSDYDGTPYPIFVGNREYSYDTQSHEFQLVGGSGNLRWVGGLYYFEDDGIAFQKQSGSMLSFHPSFASYQMANYSIGTEAQALYGQADYDMGRWSLGLGGRYTKEQKSVRAWRYKTNSAFVQTGANTVDLSGTAEWTDFTPTFNVLYRLNDNTNVFARVAKGFKSGGFPAEAPVVGSTSAPNKPFNPEESTAYELGLKGNTLGGKLQYSANVFLMDVKNYQVSFLPGGSISPTIVNAGRLETKGLEVDATYTINSAARVSLAYGYLNAKFKEFLVPNPAGAMVDAAGNVVPAGAPKHTLTISPNVRVATLNDMPLRFIADFRYIAERYTYPGFISATAANAGVGNSAAESLMPAQTMVDLKLHLSNIKMGGPGTADLSFWVKNALDEKDTVAHMDVSGFYQMGYWSDPRTYGMTFNYRW